MAPVVKTGKQPEERKRRKKPKKKIKLRKLCLKTCWLKTPEDWARFNAWAAKNALPRKIPEAEPMVRQSKPLKRLKKRIRILSKPTIHKAPDQCKTPMVSKAALKARPTKRLKRLARPSHRDEPEDCCDRGISYAALRYKASENIIKLSMPALRDDPEDCRDGSGVSRAALKRQPSEKDAELSKPKRFKGDDEGGEESCKEPAELSEWVDFLAIPGYRVLRDQKTENAMKYKERFLNEIEPRRKQAYEEQMKKRAEERRKEEERRRKEEEALKESAKEELVAADGQSEQPPDETQEEEIDEASPEGQEEEPKKSAKKSPRPVVEEDPVKKAQRKKEKEAWRFVESGCVEFPPKIPKTALTYEATEAIQRMAQPLKRESDSCKDPFKIKESAKKAQASPRVEELAKPKYPVEPVQRPPPREKDEFGRPIICKPPYGKKMPKRKPYKDTRECPEKKEAEGQEEEDEGEEEEMAPEEEEGAGEKELEKEPKEGEESKSKKKQVDPIVNAPTIDPFFDPIGAEKQRKARKRAAEEAGKNENNDDAAVAAEGADENEEKNEETEEA